MKELTQQLIEYEQGNLDDSETIQLFQELVDSGLAWNLQGHYGRTAYALLQEGLINAWQRLSAVVEWRYACPASPPNVSPYGGILV